jgi:hypothetical protein
MPKELSEDQEAIVWERSMPALCSWKQRHEEYKSLTVWKKTSGINGPSGVETLNYTCSITSLVPFINVAPILLKNLSHLM